jgi:hypothetical protein
MVSNPEYAAKKASQKKDTLLQLTLYTGSFLAIIFLKKNKKSLKEKEREPSLKKIDAKIQY